MTVVENTPKAVESTVVATKSGIENIKNSLFENEMKEIIQKHLPSQTQTDLQIEDQYKHIPNFDYKTIKPQIESKISISKFPNDEKRVIADIRFSKGNIIEKNFRDVNVNPVQSDPVMMNLLGKNNYSAFDTPLPQNDPRVRELVQGVVNKITQERALEGKPVSIKVNNITGDSAQIIIQDSVAEIKTNAEKGVSTQVVDQKRLDELEKIEFINNSRP